MPADFMQRLVEIRMERDRRDVLVIQNALLPAAVSLRKSFNKWRNEEFKSLREECDALRPMAMTLEAKGELGKIETELNQIEVERVSNARDKLEFFIREIENRKMQNPSEVFKEIEEDLWPTLSLITDLMGFRSRLDAMAAMSYRPSTKR